MIPEINLSQIVAGRPIPPFPAFEFRYEGGGLLRHQLDTLITILLVEQPREVLEIGTFHGMTTRAMAECLPHAIIHTVDLPIGATVEDIPGNDKHLVDGRILGREFLGSPCEKRIVQHYHDTKMWDFREAGSPTFFFIDASHTYEGCKNDSGKCLELAREGSIMLWHDCDYEHPGVVQVLTEWRNLGRDVRLISGTPLAFYEVHPV